MKGSLNIIPGVQGAMSRSTSRDGKCRKRDGAFSTNRRLEKPQLKAFMKLATKCRDMVRPEFPISLQSCSAVGDTVIFPPPSFVSPPLFFLDPLILILLLSPQPVSLLPFISCQGSIFFKKTEVQLILSVVFVSCVQQSESTLYIHIHPLFFFHSFPLQTINQSTAQSCLCYTAGSHQLPILYTPSVVYMCQFKCPNSSPWCPYVCYLCLCLYCCSVAKLCPTLCDPMDCSTPGSSVLHYLPEFAQTYVHRLICTGVLDSTCMC